ncbi:MaoC/PaaZ C-terminal domain-containing protein [Pseudolysinimonas kribbensis]|uniref:Acyl dehydratase n=1 Tax=Pseudolysinimonas kribbensis TaxID=433641 RepID=A0ABQ6K1X4_9MICO|nr:MaoC/PaaZ C-terminal domain-containing protein [Pseudolysinimonas kribbensis]GMA94463.1 acyl dehydratase [Pseudolysinimonas kribbensis]
MSALEVGELIAESDVHLTREALARYARASGDLNPIHLRDDVATRMGLPGVIAHGMLTMGLAIQPVLDWLGGDPRRILDYQVRFTRMVPVDEVDGAHVHVRAVVGSVGDPAGTRIDLTVTVGESAVLGKAQVRVAP